MAEPNNDPGRVHCYTNPSFCRQSEFIPDETNAELPPPLQFQGDDLPLPPPPPQQQFGLSNPGFHSIGVDANPSGRYVYLDEPNCPVTVPVSVPAAAHHRRYASLPVEEPQLNFTREKYDYIPDETQLQRHGSSRYAYVPNQQVIQPPRSVPQTNQDDGRRVQTHNGRRYAEIPGDQQQVQDRDNWTNGRTNYSPAPPQQQQQQATSRGEFLYKKSKDVCLIAGFLFTGRYARVPLQEEDPPALPERNAGLSISPRNNQATQKLHEILTTPRKPRSRSEERTLSPKRQQMMSGTPQRRALTPGSSPSGI